MSAQKSIKGIWLESLGANCAISNPTQLIAALEFAKAQGFSDVFLQIYREGRAWFPSRVAGQEHLTQALGNGFNPLDFALQQATRLGLRLHGWFNIFNLGLNRGAKILAQHGERILLSDNLGVSLSRYSENGTPPDSRAGTFVLDAPNLWLDPSSPEVREYVFQVVSEALAAAPDLAGVHFDFFRYPYFLPIQPSSRISCGYELGYGEESRKRFESDCDCSDAFAEDERGALRPRSAELSLKFDQWRRGLLTSYLEAARQIAGSRALSVACLAWPERAYFTAFQNWRAWLEGNLLDQACLMAYTADDEHFRHLIKQAVAFQGEKAAVLAGIGTYLHSDEKQTAAQCEEALRLGAVGSVVFSYENLRKRSAQQ